MDIDQSYIGNCAEGLLFIEASCEPDKGITER